MPWTLEYKCKLHRWRPVALGNFEVVKVRIFEKLPLAYSYAPLEREVFDLPQPDALFWQQALYELRVRFSACSSCGEQGFLLTEEQLAHWRAQVGCRKRRRDAEPAAPAETTKRPRVSE